MNLIRPFDKSALRDTVRASKPVPWFAIDNFLEPEFAEECRLSFPSFADAEKMGRKFSAVNEKNKVQITDSSKFAPPLQKLNNVLSSQEWLDTMSFVMDMPHLLEDASLTGGGIHETGPRGHLDVHLDFNWLRERDMHRRLNILVYFNKDWQDSWGGDFELWDKDVTVCQQRFAPVFNRCVVFNTNEISYHGVRSVTCPEGQSRKSFAAYYYTKAASPDFTGQFRNTLFKPRPDEKFKGAIAMPAEQLSRGVKSAFDSLKQTIKKTIG